MEGVLWGTVQVKHLLLNACDAEKNRGGHGHVAVDSSLDDMEEEAEDGMELPALTYPALAAGL